MINLLFIDSQTPSVNQFTDGCNENTRYIIYDSNKDTFEKLKQKTNDLNLSNIDNLGFVFVDDHNPLKFFVSFNSFISFDQTGIKENNTTIFIKELVTKYNIKTIDFLACNLLSYPEWKSYFDYLMYNNSGVIVRASNDQTGNLIAGGDWILESTNDNIKDLYFNNNIDNWNFVLDVGLISTILTNDPINNLYTCGVNTNGQLGLGDFNQRIILTQVTQNIIGQKIIGISCGNLHTAIITDEPYGNLYTCGVNLYGRLGLNDYVDRLIFTKVIPNIGYKKVLDVACGYFQTFIMTDERINNLYACGLNTNGQLGLNDNFDRNIFTQVTQNISGKKIIGVASGSNHTAIITHESTNNLYTAGSNFYGQLGINDNFDKNTFTQVTQTISGKKVIGLACGAYHTLVITNEDLNNLYTCGICNFGQLGLNDLVNRFSFTQVTETIGGKKVIGVSCGSYQSVIITNESTNNLYACGHNGAGRLGLNDTVTRLIFTKVTQTISGKKIIDIACGAFHTAIITDETTNNLYACGNNVAGQLGLNDQINRLSFTQVTPTISGKKIIGLWGSSTSKIKANLPLEPIIYFRPLTLSNSVELYWYPSNINDDITSFIVECSNISYIDIVLNVKTTIRNLITGNSYVFTVKSANLYGNSNPVYYNFVMPGYKPNYPTTLDFTNNITDYSTMDISFINPIFTGNSNLTYNTMTMIPVDVTGNVLSKSSFIHNHSNEGSNIFDSVYHEDFNTNYNYKTYIQSVNTVNDSDKNYFSYIMNPSLPTNGLKLWLDPYDLTTLTFSNNKVIKWEDKSKNKANATIVESIGPTYDSSNALINFNGNQYLNLPANTLPSANSSYSIFTYVSTSNISRNGQWFLYSGSPSSNLSLGGFINSNSIVHSWGTNQLSSSSNISTNISYLVELTYSYAYTPNGNNDGIRKTFINGLLVGQDIVSNRNSGTANNLIGTNSNFTGNLIGSVGDIIVYDRILNNLERNSVKNYLERKKYNLSFQNIGNVITWLDATDPNYLFDSSNEIKSSYNDYVYNWIDRSYSNNNASQSNIANLPVRRINVQNNLDAIEFNQSFLTLPTAKYPLDAFIVLKLANISDQNGVLGIGPSGNNYSSLSDIFGSRWAIDATSNSIVAANSEVSGNFLLMEWSIANNNNFIKRFGSNIVSSSIGTWTLPNNSNIFIGNANGFDFSKKFKGYIGEIMMFNRQLDDNERYPIEGYLSWKWGLQSNLSSNHPYKNSAPYLFYKYG